MSLHYSFLQFQKQLRRFDEEKEADSNGQSDKLDKNEVDDEFFEKEAKDSDGRSDKDKVDDEFFSHSYSYPTPTPLSLSFISHS